jgi:hypothetical protein
MEVNGASKPAASQAWSGRNHGPGPQRLWHRKKLEELLMLPN